MNAVDTEIDAYLEGVRAALADLPDEARDDLLEDLPAHLAEIVDEHEGTLTDRLGPPAVYAAELRAAAGLDATAPSARTSPLLATAVAKARGIARSVDRTVGPWLGYQRASDFLRLLRPAWWLFRGYAIGTVLVGHPGVPPGFGEAGVIGWLVVLPCVVLSVRLEAVSRRLPAWGRYLAYGALTLAVLAVAVNLLGTRGTYSVDPSYGPDRWNQVTDVFPFDGDGRPLSDVQLYDQNGNPLQFGEYWRCTSGPETAAPRYPLCKGPRANAPSVPPSVAPSVGPSVGPSAVPSVRPSATAADVSPSGR